MGTVDSYDLPFITNNTERLRILSSGNIGFGLTAPTAVLHLKGGTASANSAPLKFTTGTNLTTPENGATEFDGSHLYFTISSTRYQIDQQPEPFIQEATV